MLKITLENEHGVYMVQEKDTVGASLTVVRDLYEDVLRSAGYVIPYEGI